MYSFLFLYYYSFFPENYFSFYKFYSQSFLCFCEVIQKRVFRIIIDTSDYLVFCTAHSYSTLHERRDLLCRLDSFSKACWTNPTAWTILVA